MEREEARDVTAPSPARRGTADMFHEVKSQFLDNLCGICDLMCSLIKRLKYF